MIYRYPSFNLLVHERLKIGNTIPSLRTFIDSYDSGRIVIDGEDYTDLVVFSDKIRDGWWRREAHRLGVEDLRDALESKPEVLVVGTGYSGLMRISPETRRYVESEGIEFLALKTAEACEAFNRLAKSRKVVAALHLTC